MVWSMALTRLGFVNCMTLQGYPDGTGFYDFESVNSLKTFECALFSHEKWLLKWLPAPWRCIRSCQCVAAPGAASRTAAPGSPETAPGAANSWRLLVPSLGRRLPKSSSWLPEAASESPLCCAVFFHRRWLPVFGYACLIMPYKTPANLSHFLT